MMLKDDGMFIFEVHHLLKLIDELQFDMIYHEHIYYYSVIFLLDYFKKYSLKIYKVDEINIHAGSIRVYVCKEGSVKYSDVDSSVQLLLSKEKLAGLDDYNALKSFGDLVLNFKSNLLSLLTKIKSDGGKVIGYGASGRANTILQFCNLDNTFLDYIIDDSPPKQGFYTPGSHIKIVDNKILNNNSYDYILLFAWAFLDEIVKKNMKFLVNGGKIIVPFPELKVIDIEDLN
jgi:hypothetical protein